MKFYKLQGAGNDFIFLSGLNEPAKNDIVLLCDRNYGVGADGLILIDKESADRNGNIRADFKMKYYNSDGLEAEFCANGARCAVILARKLFRLKDRDLVFMAGDGLHRAQITADEQVRIEIRKPKNYVKGIKFKGFNNEFYYVNTGVAHIAGFFDDISDIDIETEGRRIRNASFIKHGANVNFIQKAENNKLKIRTYEKGVEAETRACGTGIAAAAFLDMMLSNEFGERTVITADNAEMSVFLNSKKLYLTGPASIVFEGKIDIENKRPT
ncbi:MAG: diaminopimelate epimerase [Candidatus Delongbacteria bacterium]